MNKFSRVLKSLLCGCILLSGLAACSSSKPTEDKTTTSNTEKKAEQSNIYSLGQEVTGKTKMAMVIDGMEETTDTGSAYLTLDEGKKLIVFDVTLTNKSTKELPYNFMYFKAKATDGVEGKMSFTTIDGTLASGSLDVDDLVKGKVVFEFPADATIKSLILTDALMQKDIEVKFA